MLIADSLSMIFSARVKLKHVQFAEPLKDALTAEEQRLPVPNADAFLRKI